MNKFKIIELENFSQENGSLIPIDLLKEIPFEIKRIYFIKDVPTNTMRGGHAHLIEKEAFFCISGSCVMKIDQNGEGKKKYFLNEPTKVIFVDNNVWHEFEKFSPGTILVALSSTEYLPGKKNYLQDYDNFCQQF